MTPVILKYFLNNKNNWLIARNHIKTLWPLLFSAEIGNTQLTKYAAQKHQQQEVNDRNTLVVSGQSIWRRQAMPRFCIRRNETMAREETSRQRDMQTSRRYLISGSFIGSRIKQSQQCPRKEFTKRVEQLSESKHGILCWNSRRNNNKTTKPKRICMYLPPSPLRTGAVSC